MKRIFFQGLTSDNHLSAVRHVLELSRTERVILSAAFLTGGGISLLRDALGPVAERTTVLAGIRNRITNSQGLAASLELGCSTYVVDTGLPQVIFHPKIYMSRNQNEARLVIGSANLTEGGLCSNIEASLLFDLELDNLEDRNLIYDLEKQIDGMIAGHPENVTQISSHADIKFLLATGRVADANNKSSETGLATKRHEKDTVPPIKLKTRPIDLSHEKMNIKDEDIPKYVNFIIPLQDSLRELGGKGTKEEIYDRIVQNMNLTEDQLVAKFEKTKGMSIVVNRIAWAKKQLNIHNYIEPTDGQGGYQLTEKGLREKIIDPYSLLKDQNAKS